MADRPKVAWRRTIAAAIASGLTLSVIIYLLRLAFGETQLDAAFGAGGAGLGVGIATVVIAVLARSPSSVFAIAPQLDTAIFSRKVPDDVDVERWLRVLRRSRRVERACVWLVPPMLLAIAVTAWIFADESASQVAFRIAAVLFAAAAIGAPFFLRWELRRMDAVEQELRSRRPE